jgi:beta-RFAP synthase
LNLATSIPAHVGLGSGTQIALAVGTALARLSGLRISTEEIALAAGRGGRSGIGIATFQHGGFILDGGHRVSLETPDRKIEKNSVPPVVFHHPVPRDWCFVTVIPGTDQGFSGEREKSAFQRLPETSSQLVEKISRLLLVKMLPALVEKDILGFGQALTAIQQMVGDCFACVQGGRFSNPLSEKLIDFLLARGAVGAGQSSWGPAVYGLIKGQRPARQLMKEVQLFLAGLGGGQAFCVRPQNRGATIKDSNHQINEKHEMRSQTGGIREKDSDPIRQ